MRSSPSEWNGVNQRARRIEGIELLWTKSNRIFPRVTHRMKMDRHTPWYAFVAWHRSMKDRKTLENQIEVFDCIRIAVSERRNVDFCGFNTYRLWTGEIINTKTQKTAIIIIYGIETNPTFYGMVVFLLSSCSFVATWPYQPTNKYQFTTNQNRYLSNTLDT